ncbi:MAG TPA: ATP-binding cassette domain-containing protein [Bauldia sp.]|nr:ATP-binding cassette domain-containing protein [Bauldia sp.]
MTGASPFPEPPILRVADVEIAYPRRGLLALLGMGQPFVAVRDFSMDIHAGETVALVGESGSGKSSIARAVAGLLPARRGRIEFEGRDINLPSSRRDRQTRHDLQMVFQNPDASLNPRHSVGFILERALRAFRPLGRGEARDAVDALLADVKLDGGYRRRFPRQLSGGERQRIAIARALAAEPRLLLCDEVLSALDVSVQAEVIDLLRSLQEARRIAILFISHDLSVVRWLAHRVVVLYRGEVCAAGPTVDVFSPPFHPSTQALLGAVPRIGHKPFPAAP